MTDIPTEPVEADAVEPVETADASSRSKPAAAVEPVDTVDDVNTASDDGSEVAATGEEAALDQPVVPPELWCIVAVADVVMDLPGAHPEVVLHEAQHPWRELRIPVGLPDGTAIAYVLRGVDTPRPLTHALVAEVLERHGISIEAVRITVRRGQSFFAEIDTMGPSGRHVFPCRPSDAIALALRRQLPTPILVADWVFEADG